MILGTTEVANLNHVSVIAVVKSVFWKMMFYSNAYKHMADSNP